MDVQGRIVKLEKDVDTLRVIVMLQGISITILGIVGVAVLLSM